MSLMTIVSHPRAGVQAHNPPVPAAVKRAILRTLAQRDEGRGVYEDDLRAGVDHRHFGRALIQMANEGLVRRWTRSAWYGPGWCLTDRGRTWLAWTTAPVILTPAPLMLPAPAPVLALPAPSPRAALEHDLAVRLAALPPGYLDVTVIPRLGLFYIAVNGREQIEVVCTNGTQPPVVRMGAVLPGRAVYAGTRRAWSAVYDTQITRDEMHALLRTLVQRALVARERAHAITIQEEAVCLAL